MARGSSDFLGHMQSNVRPLQNRSMVLFKRANQPNDILLPKQKHLDIMTFLSSLGPYNWEQFGIS